MIRIIIGILFTANVFNALSGKLDFGEGLLWEISGNGLQEPSYLFGTLHLICPDEFVIFPGIHEKLAKSTNLVLELDLSDPQLLMGVQMGMVMKNGAQLNDFLNDEEMELAKSFFTDSLSMDIGFLSRIQPFFLSTLLYPHMLNCFPQSYEQYFLDQAREREMEVIGLETLEEQLHVFEALTYREQADMLMEILKEYNEKRVEFRRMLDLYLAADLDGLWQMFEETKSGTEEFNRRLLQERNHRWIERMTLLMEEEPVFFALGAGHLPGDEGILQLLVEKGYVLERVVE
jgi:uncharacterized protein